MNSPVVEGNPKDTLDLTALEDDLQYWMDLMPEHLGVEALTGCSCGNCGCGNCGCASCSACGC